MNYDFECTVCGWTGHRYSSLRVCPDCRRPVQRMMTEAEIQADEIKQLQDALRNCVNAIKTVEWTGDSDINYDWCIWCDHERPNHENDCPRELALAAAAKLMP